MESLISCLNSIPSNRVQNHNKNCFRLISTNWCTSPSTNPTGTKTRQLSTSLWTVLRLCKAQLSLQLSRTTDLGNACWWNFAKTRNMRFSQGWSLMSQPACLRSRKKFVWRWILAPNWFCPKNPCSLILSRFSVFRLIQLNCFKKL